MSGPILTSQLLIVLNHSVTLPSLTDISGGNGERSPHVAEEFAAVHANLEDVVEKREERRQRK